MSVSSILERNMLALSSSDPSLSARLGTCAASCELSYSHSKNGFTVPYIQVAGRKTPLHSTVNPIKEGERFYEHSATGGFLIFLGFAGGYHVEPFLQRSDISGILIIEESLSYFKSILSHFELKSMILDPRVQWLIEPGTNEIENLILDSYLPAVSGDLRLLPLRSRTGKENIFFDSIASIIHTTINSLSEDYSVQSYFGKRWFTNSLKNLKAAGESTTTIYPVKRAFITGAGPSLERALPRLAELKSKGDAIIATDTSLPVLLHHNIFPDIVISIDCQHITYHHFLKGYPEAIPLVIDLASPVFLSRMSKFPFFFTSGHPFSQYINSHWRKFPFIDTSGGNVSHAAVSLAGNIGAEEIHLFGADFSYPQGKSYSRGTYIYPHFHSGSKRFSPTESRFLDFLFNNASLTKEIINNSVRYTTRPMISYRNRLSLLSQNIDARIIHHHGDGLSIDTLPKNRSRERGSVVGTLFSAGKSNGSWDDFLKEYSRKIKKLPKANVSFYSFMDGLSAEEKSLCVTLFPACAAIRRENSDVRYSYPGAKILNEAKEWTIETIKCYLP
jgi:hypothetical protein